MSGHAGTVPMPLRRDAAAAAAEIVLHVEKRCSAAPTLVGTVGRLAVPNGAINVIPGRCDLSLDIRAGDDATRDAAAADVLAEIDRIVRRRNVASEVEGNPARPGGAVFAGTSGAVRACHRARRAACVFLAERRRPRRRDVQRRHRRRHAVRALRQWRHQPFAARNRHGGGCRRCGAHPHRYDFELRACP